MYVHCSSHRLNLAIVSACKIAAFKNAEVCIGEIARFFDFSPKKQRLFDRAVEKITIPSKAKKLKDACRTRWVQRVDSYVVFEELLPAVHTTLQAIAHPRQFEELGSDWNWDGESITKANGFLYQLESSSFLICFRSLLKLLSYLREITIKLQMRAIDVAHAYKEISSVASTLNSMRIDSKAEFKKIFDSTTKLGQSLHGEHFELQKPRIVGRQAHRSNPDVSSTEDYFRITLFDEFLSHIVAELQDRFIDNPAQWITLGLLSLLPQSCTSEITDELPAELTQVVDYYSDDVPHPLLISTEYEMWVKKWKQQRNSGNELPNKLVNVLDACSPLQFPNLSVLLRLALTLPVSSCECERSFSQLKIIKTYIRSTMTGSRLSGLAVMKVHREYCDKLLCPDKLQQLVQKFSQLHPRRMTLPTLFIE